MLLITFLIFCALCSNLENILILFSNETSTELLKSFELYPTKLEIEFFDYQKIPEISLIIDITDHPVHFNKLDILSNYYQVIILSLSKHCEDSFSSARYCVLPNNENESFHLSKLITFLGWKSCSLISSSSQASLTFSQSLKTHLKISTNFSVLQENSDELYMSKMIKKLIKSSGGQNFIVSGTSGFLKLFQDMIQVLKANKPNFTFVFPSFTIDDVWMSNSLIFSLKGTNESSSLSGYKLLYIQNLIKEFYLYKKIGFERLYESHNCVKSFEVLRITDKGKEKAALVDEDVQVIDSELLENMEKSKMTEILLFVANGTAEANESSSTANTIYYEGAFLGIETVNNNQELDGYKYQLQSTNCGNLVDNMNFTLKCLAQFNSIQPVAYLTSLYPRGVLSNLNSLRILKRNIIQISPLINHQTINDQTLYPEFLSIVTILQDYNVGGALVILRNMGWKEVIFYLSDEYEALFSWIIEMFSQNGIKIVNPKEFAVFPRNYTREDFVMFKKNFMFAKNKKMKVFCFLSQQEGSYIEGIYDVGYRKGEFITIINHQSYSSILNSETNSIYINKRKELLQGNLVGGYKEFDGELGENIKKTLQKSNPDVSNMCLTHDSFLTIHNSIKYLNSVGDDFEDSGLLMKTIRRQKFIGCLGTVYFSSDSNQRSGVKYLFKQVVFNKTTEKLELFDFLLSDRFSVNILQVLGHSNWVDSTETPSYLLDYGLCPFNPRLKKESLNGKRIVFIISGLLLTIVSISATLSWLRFRRKDTVFDETKTMGLSDIIIFIYFIAEFFQMIALEPKDGIFIHSFVKFNLTINFNIQDYFNTDFQNFWKYYNVLLGVILLYFFCGLLVFLNNLKCIRKEKYSKNSGLLITVLIVVGNLFYMPMIDMLFEVAECFEGLGNELTSSFLKHDCYTFCYTGKHLYFFIFGMISLFLFALVSTMSRPYWEISLTDSNLRTKTFYLSILSFFQVLLVVLNKLQQASNSNLLGFGMSVAILFFAFFTLRVSCYNLIKAKVVQFTVLIMSAWGIFLSNLFVWADGGAGLIILNFSVLLVIFLTGGIYSCRNTKGFKAEKGISVSALIKFQFSRNFSALLKDTIFLNKNANRLSDYGDRFNRNKWLDK